MGNRKKIAELNKQLETVNKLIAELETELINNIQTVGLELIDLYTVINQLNTLTTRKNTIQYLIAIETL